MCQIFSMSHMWHQLMWSECASKGGGRQLYLVLQLLSLLFAAESFYSAKWHCIFKFCSSGLLWSINMSLSADNDTTLCHATLVLFPFNGAQGYFSSSEALLAAISLITVAGSITDRGNEVSQRFATDFVIFCLRKYMPNLHQNR